MSLLMSTTRGVDGKRVVQKCEVKGEDVEPVGLVGVLDGHPEVEVGGVGGVVGELFECWEGGGVGFLPGAVCGVGRVGGVCSGEERGESEPGWEDDVEAGEWLDFWIVWIR
jgi:hypothetical protein